MLALCLSTPLTANIAAFDELHVGQRVYYEVVVTGVTPESLTLRHAGGLAQVYLRDLAPALQERFGYRPEAAEIYREQREAARAREVPAPRRIAKDTAPSALEAVLERFGNSANYEERVDLRPQFNELDLYAKQQGRRPSCAVFAVVSALEFESAKANGEPEMFSEDYLIWATRESLGIPQAVDADFDPARDGDLGFSLVEVIQALRRYGVAPAEAMPNTFGKAMARIEPPPQAVIEDARNRRQIEAFYLTGRTNADKIEKIVHLLNADIPVVVGVAWPHSATLQTAPFLSKQKPLYGHAVTLVGYQCASGQREDARFLFKNSWGPQWGIAGYGWITYDYLNEHLGSAAFLTLRSQQKRENFD